MPNARAHAAFDLLMLEKYTSPSLRSGASCVAATTDSRHEENLSTQPYQAGTDPRVPRSHGDPQWSQGARGAPCQGPGPTHPLSSSEGPCSGRDQGLPKRLRLRCSAEFRRVFAQPVRSIDSYFTVLAGSRRPGPARLGLAVSKKCARRAVDRSRVKRIVRESFRLVSCSLPPVDIVVLCRPTVQRCGNPRLFRSLTQHWQRIRDQLCVDC
jgi:ribonuclease P protein component